MQDFLVVGAGPAGSRFARQAATTHTVRVFEQGEVGKPLACSGHVSTDIWKFLPEGAEEELLQNEIYGARFHTGGANSDARTFYKDTVVSNVIDRVQLDRCLARSARSAGADIRENHTVVGLTEFRDFVELEVRGPDGLETHRGRMVAGCDGPQSRVRQETGLPEPDELLHGVLGFAAEPDHQDYVDVHLTVPGFFAWRIPRGNAGVEYGLAMPPGNDVRRRFEEFTDDYDVNTDDRCSGLIPIGPPPSITSGRIFLIGDAAGHNKPFTGGGILYGMTAADCAARVIRPDDPGTLETYETAWRGELMSDITLGHLVRKGYSLPGGIQEVAMALLEGEIGVHMDRPTTLLSRDHIQATFSKE